jgi:hypothetical protein
MFVEYKNGIPSVFPDSGINGHSPTWSQMRWGASRTTIDYFLGSGYWMDIRCTKFCSTASVRNIHRGLRCTRHSRLQYFSRVYTAKSQAAWYYAILMYGTLWLYPVIPVGRILTMGVFHDMSMFDLQSANWYHHLTGETHTWKGKQYWWHNCLGPKSRSWIVSNILTK